MLILAAGFVLSLMGSLPPGLISLTVAQTSISKGMAAALVLALGAALAEFFQAWAAVVLTDWFLSHPSVERGFQWVAVLVFWSLGLYLLFWAKTPASPVGTTTLNLRGQFYKGLIISAFNLLAVPYWFVYCGWLRVEGYWEEGLFFTLVFSLGVSIGTLFALGLYAWLGQVILHRSALLARYANRLIGLIFLGLGAKVFFELI